MMFTYLQDLFVLNAAGEKAANSN